MSVLPLCLGQQTRYNGRYKGQPSRKTEQIPLKAGPSSDWGLKPAPMKPESLVTVGQHTTVNTFPGLVQNKCAWQF